MSKKDDSLKGDSLRAPIGTPIGKNEKKPLRKSLKEPIGKHNPDLSPEQNAMFDALIEKAATFDDENHHKPESNNQELLIADLRKLEQHYNALLQNSSKTLEEKNYPLRKALDALHYYFKRELGQSPAWLFNAIEENLGKLGRPVSMTQDIKETACNFIKLLILFGSSKTQAVSLFGVMRGNIVVAEAYKLELMKVYNDFLDNHDNQSLPYSEIADILSYAREITSTSRISRTEEAISKALAALKRACDKLLSFLKSNIEAVQKIDPDYEDRYSLILPLLAAPDNESISCLFRSSMKNENYDDFGYQLRMFVYTAEHHAKTR